MQPEVYSPLLNTVMSWNYQRFNEKKVPEEKYLWLPPFSLGSHNLKINWKLISAIKTKYLNCYNNSSASCYSNMRSMNILFCISHECSVTCKRFIFDQQYEQNSIPYTTRHPSQVSFWQVICLIFQHNFLANASYITAVHLFIEFVLYTAASRCF